MDKILEQLRTEFAAELDGLDAAETQMHPHGRPDAWTTQQIVEHLMLTYSSTAETMKVRLERGAPTKAKATVINCMAQVAVGRLGLIPKGRKAPAMVQPGESRTVMDGRRLMAEFSASLETMDEQLSAVEQAFGTVRSVSHTVLGPMSIADWRRFHRAHGRHHLRQMRRILHDQTVGRDEKRYMADVHE